MLSDPELAELLATLESDRVERKRSAADRSAIRRTICAFANDLPGHGRPGVIFVGVDDNGDCAGLNIDDELLKLLAQMHADGNILPPPTMTVEKRTIAGCDLAVVTVSPSSSPPVQYQGRVYVKIGPTVQQASPEDERRLTERRRAADLTFDRRPVPSATIDELDLDYFRAQYLPRAVAPDVLEQNRRSTEQQLESLRLTLAGTPTNASLLGIGRDPQRWLPGAYVQFLRIDGLAVTDPIQDQKQLTGRLEDILRRLDELLEINISVRTDVTASSVETRRPDYPLVALQQFVRNAIMHRNYENTNAPVRVYWYSDRVETMSPGGLYGQVTRQNFGKGITDYRNPLVAEIMHHLGFAQRFGLGIPLALDALAANGNPEPTFYFEPTTVGVTVRPAP
ncbi:MAG: RNA-binding domain-containing protein [Longimicrobiales bacterium]